MRGEDNSPPFITKIIALSLAVLLALIALFGSVLFRTDAPVSGAVRALSSASAGNFAQVTPGLTLRFPRDYAAHEDFRQEWWYITANLTDKHDRQYGVQWTLFRTAVSDKKGEAWNSNQIYMAHAVVTSENGVFSAERFARGGIEQAGVIEAPFNAWLDNWQWRAVDTLPFPAILEASDDDFSFRLNMSKKKEEVLQGDAGYSRKHASKDVASYYFSVPSIEMSGAITINGERIEVSGLGWMDREWSTAALSDDQKGWNWFSMHLDDDRALMVVQVRGEDAFYRFGSLTDEHGKSRTLTHDEISMTPISFDKMPTGRHLPTEWEIKVPSADLTLQTKPLRMGNWLEFSFPYWEGPINISGSQTGVGFMEATGY